MHHHYLLTLPPKATFPKVDASPAIHEAIQKADEQKRTALESRRIGLLRLAKYRRVGAEAGGDGREATKGKEI